MKLLRVLVSISVIFLNLAPLSYVVASEEEYLDEFELEYLSDEVDYSYLRLNEVMPNPEGSDTDYEWVEIRNDLDDQIDLDDCLVDGKEFVEGQIIEGGDYLVVVKDLLDKDEDGQSFEERYGDGSGDWGDSETEDFSVVEMSISMKNSDDSIVLECLDHEDMFEWVESESGQSFSIDEDGEWTSEYLVTPGRENEPLPEIVYPHTIQISEVYPSPLEEESEWVELFNYGGEDIDINGWYLEDGTKMQRLEDLKILGAESYLVLEDELSITLNNSGENLTLYDPDEEEVDRFEYESTDKGLSNIRKFKNEKYEKEVFQTQEVTKGEQNTYVDPADLFYGKKLMSIKNSREHEFGEELYISGVITVELDLLGSKLFYIQDETGGIQVYLYDETFWDDFEVGDEVEVVGELKESNGESKVYVREESGIKKVGTGKVKTVESKTGSISEKTEGQLVFVSGEITKTSGKSFYIDDGSGEIKILIKSSTGIDTPSKKKGQYAGIVGIVSQYGDEEDSYRVLARYASDILISNEPVSYGQVLAVTGREISNTILTGFFLVTLLIVLNVVKGLRIKD
jgi:uncharacterized protein YdeI (BOF family)